MAQPSHGVQLIIAILSVYVIYRIISIGRKRHSTNGTGDEASPTAPDVSGTAKVHTWVKGADTDNMHVRARGDITRSDFKGQTVVAMIHRGCGHCSNPAFRETLKKVSQRHRVLVITDEGSLKSIPKVDDKVPFVMSRVGHFPALLMVDVGKGKISHPKNEPTRRTEEAILAWVAEDHLSLNDMRWEKNPVKTPSADVETDEMSDPLTSEEREPETMSSQNERGREHLPKSNTDYSGLITAGEEKEEPFKSDARESIVEGISEDMRYKWQEVAHQALQSQTSSETNIENLWS